MRFVRQFLRSLGDQLFGDWFPGERARSRLYLFLGAFVGPLELGLVGALYLGGIFTQFLPIGLPSLISAQLLLRPLGRWERRLAGSLLGLSIPAPAPLVYPPAGGTRVALVVTFFRRGWASFRDGHSWRVLVWLLGRSVGSGIGALGVLVEALGPVAAVLGTLTALADVVGPGTPVAVPGGYPTLLAVVVTGLVLPRFMRPLVDGICDLHRGAARWALGPGPSEVTAAALARARAAEERIRIDQELHDSLGHLLSMIVVQAGAGAHVFDTDPEFARSALRTIEARGRAALGELDRIIADLRDSLGPLPGTTGALSPSADSSPVAAATGRYRPLPSGQDLPELIAGATEAGLRVRSRLRTGDLPPAVGTAVYRIVQEGLTNAAKHAPGQPVTVDVASDAVGVAVSLANPVATAEDAAGTDPGTPERTRRGLASVRERAALLGGQATVGTTDDGRFVVRVVVPVGSTLPDGAITCCSLGPTCSCLGCEIRRSVLG